ncbi:MAG: glycoside hydrolase family 65 [Butyrivibrio sp.]|nr:glycoside hydrolase family 65 [Butyrivibrio sp.]
MIDRKSLIQKHNPHLEYIDLTSPFTIGNGNLAFTADVTGLQSLYDEYNSAFMPLTCMHKDAWHIEKDVDGKTYMLSDVDMTVYESPKGPVSYGVEKKTGNEHIYDWVRQNPHRFNLMKIALEYDNKPLSASDINDIKQELDIYTGCLSSSFTLQEHSIKVLSICSGKSDCLSFKIAITGQNPEKFRIKIAFPYPSPQTNGGEFDSEKPHKTELIKDNDRYLFNRIIDEIKFEIRYSSELQNDIKEISPNNFGISSDSGNYQFSLFINFDKKDVPREEMSFAACRESSEAFWKEYWEKGGIISFEGSEDKRAFELERREILSMYLLRINSCLDMPPQETGLTVNSWYGKSHLEMHLWHEAWLPLWGRSELLLPSLSWYKKILDNAKANAKRNNYKGARWPKMVGPEGIDCPSKISMLLVWQQPHILFMLNLIISTLDKTSGRKLLEEYREVIYETAEFMADFPVYNKKKDRYELCAPLIPAQERHKPMDTLNPVYEVAYWKYGLRLAIAFFKELGNEIPENWVNVYDKMARPVTIKGLYPAHEKCPNTFKKFAEDHPSMVAALGLLDGCDIDKPSMLKTIEKIYKTWDFSSLWGWDFAMLAMTLTRLNKPEDAIDILLKDTAKNTYSVNGHNYQKGRKDLPLYLPGNGSLLLALALMVSGFGSNPSKYIGFPKEFKITVEGIYPFPD